MRATIRVLFAALLLAAVPLACDDEGDPAPADGGGGSGGSGGSGGACAEVDTPHEQLLNAPTDAEVVRKEPTHPPIGPEGLP